MTHSRSTDLPAFVAGVLMACSASLTPAIARADDTAEARRLFTRGEQAYQRESWDEALEAYTSAYEVAPLPGFLFNIGQCHRKLGHWDAAADFFRRYLEALPEAPNRADAEELLAEVEAHLAPVEPQPPPPVAPALPPPPPPGESAPSGRPVRLPTWIAFGAGVAFAGVAVAFALDLSAAQSSFDDASLDCARNPDRCRSLRDRGDTAATARTVFALCAGAALATGGVLLVLDLRSARSPAESLARGAPRLRLGLSGVAAEVTW